MLVSEKVLNTPFAQSMPLYYARSRKLAVYNFCVYERELVMFLVTTGMRVLASVVPMRLQLFYINIFSPLMLEETLRDYFSIATVVQAKTIRY